MMDWRRAGESESRVGVEIVVTFVLAAAEEEDMAVSVAVGYFGGRYLMKVGVDNAMQCSF